MEDFTDPMDETGRNFIRDPMDENLPRLPNLSWTTSLLLGFIPIVGFVILAIGIKLILK